MAAHFIYKHVPASGIGQRNVRRPYVTGGLGAFIVDFLMRRTTRAKQRKMSAQVEGRNV